MNAIHKILRILLTVAGFPLKVLRDLLLTVYFYVKKQRREYYGHMMRGYRQRKKECN